MKGRRECFLGRVQTAGFHITSVVQGGAGEFTPSGPVSGNTEDEMKVSHAGEGDWARRLVESGQVQGRGLQTVR